MRKLGLVSTGLRGVDERDGAHGAGFGAERVGIGEDAQGVGEVGEGEECPRMKTGGCVMRVAAMPAAWRRRSPQACHEFNRLDAVTKAARCA